MEYILLISFVVLGSSAVLASEFQSAGNWGKGVTKAHAGTVSSMQQRNVIFGQSTKRHIK
jgi:hypothetical protein